MRKILITGGTTFVSRFAAEYFVAAGDEVYVLNRNQKPQADGVILIEADRHNLGEKLKGMEFDAVLDIVAYTKEDISDLLEALGSYGIYIMVSSSAVYPDTEKQPFRENTGLGKNAYWGSYGTNKIEAERELLRRDANAYILRPPYLYGELDNIYREAFVFDCAMQQRRFYLPGDGSMKLQFFHVKDLCRVMEAILQKKPAEHIYNVGNEKAVSIKEWVEACYRAAGRQVQFVNVRKDIEQRAYFPFHRYEYVLDVTKQSRLVSDTLPMEEGLKKAYEWYVGHQDEVGKKDYIEYIDQRICC